MGKYGFFIYQLFKHPDETFTFLGWLIPTIIEVVILSLIIAGIAKLLDKDFEEWFKGSCVVLGIIEVLLVILSLFS